MSSSGTPSRKAAAALARRPPARLDIGGEHGAQASVTSTTLARSTGTATVAWGRASATASAARARVATDAGRWRLHQQRGRDGAGQDRYARKARAVAPGTAPHPDVDRREHGQRCERQNQRGGKAHRKRRPSCSSHGSPVVSSTISARDARSSSRTASPFAALALGVALSQRGIAGIGLHLRAGLGINQA